MKQKLFLIGCLTLLMAVTGCSKPSEEDKQIPAVTIPVTEATEAAQPSAEEEKVHVTVESVEVTVDELKENDYIVPVLVTLDKNPNISYFEWGVYVDKACTFTQSSRGMDFGTVAAINEEKNFLWAAWGGIPEPEASWLLTLNVKLPMDAAPGSTYSITYSDTSQQEGGRHKWSEGSTNYAEENAVGWTDGGITVVE